jgi:hypothetical protein
MINPDILLSLDQQDFGFSEAGSLSVFRLSRQEPIDPRAVKVESAGGTTLTE